jgi:choline dehydrogenase-like flavoprotein
MLSALRSQVSLAEAILPGSVHIPAADERTVASAEEVAGKIHPMLPGALRVALQALDAAALASTGKPFRGLSASEQDQQLERWEHDPILRAPLALVSLLYKLVHFDRIQPLQPGNGSGGLPLVLDQPRWLRQVHRADDWSGGDIECDVVVVGTGAGGAVVGHELARLGHAVAFLEEGEHYRRDAFDGSTVRAHERFYRAAFSVGNVVMPIFVGRLVGGSTAVNGGTSFRTPPWILSQWCDEMGTDDFAPVAMDGYFDRVEAVLGVQPAGRAQIGPIADVMARGCEALGWSHFPVRRNAPDCDGSGFCDFGCGRDARRSTNIAFIPPALERGSVLLCGARVDRVLVDDGVARGVEAVSPTGRRVRVRASAVVLAGGAIPTPLLLQSQGLCRRSGQVGRNLSLHPSTGLSAVFDEDIEGHRFIPQGYGCDQFLKDGILILAAQATRNVAPVLFSSTGRRLMEALSQMDHIASFGLMIRDASANGRVWREAMDFPAISYQIADEDVARMHRTMVHTMDMCLAAGARTIYPNILGVDPVRDARGFHAFRKRMPGAADFVWLSYHPLGTCKMGRDPKTSVIDLDHETHDVRSLFVVDASAVRGPIGVNPQLTIMAIAMRAADRIAARLGRA